METTNEKRLLKDLPFDNLVAGTVLIKRNRGYEEPSFDTYYETGGSSSSRGTKCWANNEAELIDTIWENDQWFEPAELKHIDIVLGRSEIKLRFDPISAELATTFAKGIAHILPHLNDKGYSWNGLGDVTTRITNR